MSLTYRSDIDGLRAVAVGSVVLFHIHLWPFSGGYVGVDIFFVISGYLITAILYREIEARRFSLLDFYDRRIRRIFPAFFVVLAVTTALATAIMIPADLAVFARGLIAAVLFVSNIQLSRISGYFEPRAEDNPLLHTWSLAVEEQFYILFPLVLFALIRWLRPSLLRPALLGLLLVSLIYSQMRLTRAPTEAFFLLPSRAWELLLGASLALGMVPRLSPRAGAAASLAGLALIVFAIVFYDRHTAFPGLAALAPCLGAAFILHGGASGGAGIVQRVLSFRAPVYLGRISYSLYLWHWPLLALASYQLDRRLTTTEGLALVVLSIGLASLSLRFVEAPFRNGRFARAGRWAPVGAGAAAMAGVVAVAAVMIARDGQFWPLSPLGRMANAEARAPILYLSQCGAPLAGPIRFAPPEKCSIGEGAASDRFDILLWGDSHASSLFAGLGEAADALGSTLRLVTLPACPPLLDVPTFHDRLKGLERQCPAFNRAALALVAQRRPKLVILAAQWSAWTDARPGQVMGAPGGGLLSREDERAEFVAGLTRTVDAVTALAIPVLLIGEVPELPLSPARCVARAEYAKTDSTRCVTHDSATTLAPLAFPNAVLLRLAGSNPRVSTVLLSDQFCDGKACITARGERMLYRDPKHLSIPGSRFAAGAVDLAAILDDRRSTGLGAGRSRAGPVVE